MQAAKGFGGARMAAAGRIEALHEYAVFVDISRYPRVRNRVTCCGYGWGYQDLRACDASRFRCGLNRCDNRPHPPTLEPGVPASGKSVFAIDWSVDRCD